MIKKLGNLFVTLILIISLNSCGSLSSMHIFDQYLHGLENYSYGALDYSICSESFIEPALLNEYAYLDGNFEAYMKASESFFNFPPFAKSFIYLQYDANTYESAKQYMIENLQHSYAISIESSIYAENGYVFYCKTIEAPPSWSFWTGFNDELKTLYFFGLYNSDYPTDITSTGETYAARAIALYEKEGFAGFLREYYSEYYDFGI